MAQSTFSSFHEPDTTDAAKLACSNVIVGDLLVETRRLDTIIGSLACSDTSPWFLKSDTQGHDLEVLRGAGSALREIIGSQVEMSVRRIYRGTPSWIPFVQEPDTMGFVISGMFPVSYDRDLTAIEVDCVVIRARLGPIA